MTTDTANLLLGDVAAGDALPELPYDVSATTIVLGALAGATSTSAAAAPRAAHSASAISLLAATRTSVSVRWGDLGRGRRVLYVVTKNGRYVGKTWNHGFTLWGLGCGARYTVAVWPLAAPRAMIRVADLLP